jgi:HTH-type transcriptional regulator / antitoxin HipB
MLRLAQADGAPFMTESTYALRVGASLRERRRLLGLTQAEVAELAGTTQRSVSLAESGKASGLALYGAIADVVGLELVARGRDGERT